MGIKPIKTRNINATERERERAPTLYMQYSSKNDRVSDPRLTYSNNGYQ